MSKVALRRVGLVVVTLVALGGMGAAGGALVAQGVGGPWRLGLVQGVVRGWRK